MLWCQGISSIFLHQSCQDCSEQFPSPGDLPNSGIEPRSPELHTDFLPSKPPGKSRTAVITTQTKTNATFPVASITVLLGYQRTISSRLPRETNLLPSSSSLRKMVKLFLFFFFFPIICMQPMGFPGGSDGKEFTCYAGHLGSSSGSGRSHRKGNSYPLQYSCLGNSMDRGSWQATVCRVAKDQTRLSN